MVDRISPEARSANMRAVKGKDTGPEIRVRKAAHSLGLRFRLQNRALPGTPDVTFARYKTVIFVHGCFWHQHPGCPKAATPKSRSDFWEAKFARNVARDAGYERQLREAGWRVIVIWECETKSMDALRRRLAADFGLSEPAQLPTGQSRKVRRPSGKKKPVRSEAPPPAR